MGACLTLGLLIVRQAMIVRITRPRCFAVRQNIDVIAMLLAPIVVFAHGVAHGAQGISVSVVFK